GVPGELCIGGAGLARAYRGRPDLTAQRFVTGPEGQRVYRTGDRVRLGTGGQIEFLGRADDQIKLRGHRIELGEIEQALAGAPGVAQAAVAVRDGELVAYLVSTQAAGASEVEAGGVEAGGLEAGAVGPVRAHITATLPRYMIPRDYVWLDRLPRTPNGKLDRAALPAPERTGAGPAAAEGAGESGPAGGDLTGDQTGDLTEVVASIWREVLQVDEIAPDDTLFDLGGHSLTIMQITARIREALGVEVPFDVFFDTPTIGEVASYIEDVQGSPAD